MNYAVVAIIAVVIIIVVGAGVWLASRAPAVPVIPSSTASPNTTAAISSAKPYISASQAGALIGSVSSYSLKTQNATEIAHNTTAGFPPNTTFSWIVNYTGANKASLIEWVIHSTEAEAFFYKLSLQPQIQHNYTTASQNGLSYMAAPYNFSHSHNAPRLFGWKGNYLVMVLVNDSSTNTTELAAAVASDLP